MSYVIPGTNYSWISSETRYRNGRLVFLGYDDAEFCANAWERQTFGGLCAEVPRWCRAGDPASFVVRSVHPAYLPGDGKWALMIELST